MSGTSFRFDQLRRRLTEGMSSGRCDEAGVRRMWWAALETLQQDVLTPGEQGIWLAAPLPALYEPQLLDTLQGWIWAPEDLERLAPRSVALPGTGSENTTVFNKTHFRRLALDPEDSQDPFLIVITPSIQMVLGLQGREGQRQLLMRSDPSTLRDVLALIGRGLQQQQPDLAEQLQEDLQRLGPLHTDPNLPQLFWPRLAERLTTMVPSLMVQTTAGAPTPSTPVRDELGLLEALTHEVRTPLATIRTLIRSLIRRRDLPDVVMKRLRQIDVECSEQIDRFGLIFHAAELQREPGEASLARTDLGRILRSLARGWTEQLERRGIVLDLDLEPALPQVLSDASRLEPMLGGLIDRACRGLPTASRLLLILRAAGARLKLQILVKLPGQVLAEVDEGKTEHQRGAQEVGTVLSWDPTTGSLQLSQQATRQLLASLGGRYRQRQDRNLTVFFPVASEPE